MTRSESITALAKSLALAQSEMKGAAKDSENPHFRLKYADLASVRDACLPALNKQGIAVIQSPRLSHAGGEMWLLDLETLVMHDSGEWMSDVLSVPVTKVDAQGVGSAITYARRYALGAIAGIAPEDDDGNAAVGTNGHAKAAEPDAVPLGQLGTVTIKVLGIVQRPAGQTGTKYIITGSDRQMYSTLKKLLADKAKDAQTAGAEIEIAWKQTNWGRDVVSLSEVGQAEPPL